MSTLSKYTNMIKGLFPANAVIEGTMEEHEYETNYGFVVTVSRDRNEPVCLRPEKIVEIKESMKADFFGMYPTEPIMPYDIRMYFYITVPNDVR